MYNGRKRRKYQREKTRVIMNTGINNGIESRSSHEKTRVFIDTGVQNETKCGIFVHN